MKEADFDSDDWNFPDAESLASPQPAGEVHSPLVAHLSPKGQLSVKHKSARAG